MFEPLYILVVLVKVINVTLTSIFVPLNGHHNDCSFSDSVGFLFCFVLIGWFLSTRGFFQKSL